MFTPKMLLPLAALLFAATLFGCEKSLDSPEYGELIHNVPPNLNRPYPLPELDPPTANPLPGPATHESGSPKSASAEPAPAEASGEKSGEPSTESAAETATESKPAASPTDESSSKAEENPE